MFTWVNFMLHEIHLNFSNPKIKRLSVKTLLEKNANFQSNHCSMTEKETNTTDSQL